MEVHEADSVEDQGADLEEVHEAVENREEDFPDQEEEVEDHLLVGMEHHMQAVMEDHLQEEQADHMADLEQDFTDHNVMAVAALVADVWVDF